MWGLASASSEASSDTVTRGVGEGTRGGTEEAQGGPGGTPSRLWRGGYGGGVRGGTGGIRVGGIAGVRGCYGRGYEEG